MRSKAKLVEEARYCLEANGWAAREDRLCQKGWERFGSSNANFKKVFTKGDVVAKIGYCNPDRILYSRMRKAGLSRYLATAWLIHPEYMIQRKVKPYEETEPALRIKLDDTLTQLREILKRRHNLNIWDTCDRNLGHLNGQLKIVDCFVYPFDKDPPWW